MVEGAGDELDGLARVLDRLAARLPPPRRPCAGLPRRRVFCAAISASTLRRVSFLELASWPQPRLASLGLRSSARRPSLLRRPARLLRPSGVLLGLLGAQLGRLPRPPCADASSAASAAGSRLHHLRIGSARGHRIVAAAAHRQQRARRPRCASPQAGPARSRRCVGIDGAVVAGPRRRHACRRRPSRLAHHHRGVGRRRRGHAEDGPPAGNRLRPVARRHGQAGIDAREHARREARPASSCAERLVGIVQHAVEGAGRRLAGDGVIERGRRGRRCPVHGPCLADVICSAAA